MQSFEHSGFELFYLDEGTGPPVLLIHGFASNARVNWVEPGWVDTLTRSGFRVIAIDNRGHGESTKSHERSDYDPELMADDAIALLEHLGVPRAHAMGYSMGSRIVAFAALNYPTKIASVVFGGLGEAMVKSNGAWETIASALLVEDPETIDDQRARAFRNFADQTKSDRAALAACISGSRKLLSEAQVRRITQQALVVVGATDDIAGKPEPLAALLPNGEYLAIAGRDHMRTVGDKAYKKRVVEFFKEQAV